MKYNISLMGILSCMILMDVVAEQAQPRMSYGQIVNSLNPEEKVAWDALVGNVPETESEAFTKLMEDVFNMPPEELDQLVTGLEQELRQQGIDPAELEKALIEGNFSPEAITPAQPTIPSTYTPPIVPTPSISGADLKDLKKSSEKKEEAEPHTLEAIKRTLRSLVRSLSVLQVKAHVYGDQALSPWKDSLMKLVSYLNMLDKPVTLEHLASAEFKPVSERLRLLKEKLALYDPEVSHGDEEHKEFEEYNPYMILGVMPSASTEDIEKAFARLSAERSPEKIRCSLEKQGITGEKCTEKIKRAELQFKPIVEAYDTLIDSETRAQIDRILSARGVQRNNREGSLRNARVDVAQVLKEALVTHDLLPQIEKILEKYSTQALKEYKEREQQAEKAAKEIEEYQKKKVQPNPPLPVQNTNGYGYGGYNYQPSYYPSYQPQFVAGGTSGQQQQPISPLPTDAHKDAQSKAGGAAKFGAKKPGALQPSGKQLPGMDAKKPIEQKEQGKEKEQVPQLRDAITERISAYDKLLSGADQQEKPMINGQKPTRGPAQQQPQPLALDHLRALMHYMTTQSDVIEDIQVQGVITEITKKLQLPRLTVELESIQDAIVEKKAQSAVYYDMMKRLYVRHKELFGTLQRIATLESKHIPINKQYAHYSKQIDLDQPDQANIASGDSFKRFQDDVKKFMVAQATLVKAFGNKKGDRQ